MTIRLSFSLFVIRLSFVSRLIGRTEQLDLLFYLVHDGCSAGSQELSRVKALALLILACLDVLSGRLCEYKLALGVYVDLGNAQRDGLFDHVIRDTGTAVQYQRHIAGLLLDLIQCLEA